MVGRARGWTKRFIKVYEMTDSGRGLGPPARRRLALAGLTAIGIALGVLLGLFIQARDPHSTRPTGPVVSPSATTPALPSPALPTTPPPTPAQVPIPTARSPRPPVPPPAPSAV